MRVSQQSPPLLVFGFLDDAGCACGDSYTESVFPPTCVMQGYTVYTCSCGDTYMGNYVPALGHDGVVVGQTETMITYLCNRCGATYQEPIVVDPNPPVEMSLRRSTVSVETEHHEYIYASGQLLREVITTTDAEGNVTTEVLDFTYDASGYPYTLTYTNGTASPVTYYYVVNLQGDVMRLVSGNGATVAEYWYGPYGEVLTASGAMAEVNPLRYRGYYYDAETGFHYLQSRYYDPAICRFVSADAYASTGQGFLGQNMFAYCNNSPINYADSSGHAIDKSYTSVICDGGSGRATNLYRHGANQIAASAVLNSGGGVGSGSISIDFTKFANIVAVLTNPNSDIGIDAFSQMVAEAVCSRFASTTGREFLFSDECVGVEIAKHIEAYYWAAENSKFPNILVVLSYARTTIDAKALPENNRNDVLNSSKCIEIFENQASFNGISAIGQTIAFDYYGGIREIYIGTPLDPFLKYRVGMSR